MEKRKGKFEEVAATLGLLVPCVCVCVYTGSVCNADFVRFLCGLEQMRAVECEWRVIMADLQA